MQGDSGIPVVFVQIAGWLARRIVCYLRPGDQGVAGERCGLIRYGSRVDVYVPMDTRLDVEKNQMVCAGETILGRVP
jgi:phosphatidylserine decarboxylase